MEIVETVYDVTVVEATEEGLIIFAAPDGRRWQFQKRQFQNRSSFVVVGEVGRLALLAQEQFCFERYADQRLRRRPDLDVPEHWLFAWEIDGGTALVKAGVLPGKDGEVIMDETESIELDVPPEFTELCQSRGLSAESVLRGFIADLAGLANCTDCPREDGYGSNGSDEEMCARLWFERAYPERG